MYNYEKQKIQSFQRKGSHIIFFLFFFDYKHSTDDMNYIKYATLSGTKN